MPILDECESMIRSGLAHVARSILLRKIADTRKYSVPEKIRLGHLLRRTGAFNETVKVLHGLARDEMASENRDLAQIEYATSLTFLGLTAEAENIFLSLNKNKYPQVLTQLSTLNTMNWDYESSVKNLENYFNLSSIHHISNDEYFNLIAEINLNISYAFVRPEKINIDRIYEIKKIVQQKNYKLLNAVTTQILGRYLTSQREYVNAERVFQTGLNTLKGQKTFDFLYLKKWQLINSLESKRMGSKPLLELALLKKYAYNLKDYETVRECDYYHSLYSKNKKLHTYCFVGSPFLHYKRKFKSDLIEEKTLFQFNPENTRYEIKLTQDTKLDLDLIISEYTSKNNTKLKKNKNLSLLLQSLTNDFYRPKTIHRLFTDLFPDQYWNPQSSPNLIRQIIFRFRQWSAANHINLKITENSKNYYLNSEDHKIVFIKNKDLNSAMNLNLNSREFTLAEFKQQTGLSQRSAERKIAELKKRGQIKTIGQTRNLKYVWINS